MHTPSSEFVFILDCGRFEYHPQHALYGFNDIVIEHTSITQCQETCVKIGEKCKSLDFVNSETCILSSQNKQTQAEYFGRHLHSDYYEKVSTIFYLVTAHRPLTSYSCRDGEHTVKIENLFLLTYLRNNY